MKNTLVVIILYVLAVRIPAQTSAPTLPFSVVHRDANSRVWARTNYETGASGQTIKKVHQYTELATGMHYQKNGQWIESKEEIEVLPQGGAAAEQGQHKAYFPSDIYEGLIEVVTPDGNHLKSRPLGINYYDGEKNVLIAELKHSVGQILPSGNQVIYTNAFTDFAADIILTYRKSGFESDLVFHEKPPVPEVFGLNSAGCELELLTEFFDTPEPDQITPISKGVPSSRINNVLSKNHVKRTNSLETIDTSLKFGNMVMTHGQAFQANSIDKSRSSKHGISVSKTWAKIQQRSLLIESIPIKKIGPEFQALPNSSANGPKVAAAGSTLHKVSDSRLLPERRFARTSTSCIEIANANLSQNPGVVLDYNLIIEDASDFTFQSGNTYLVMGQFNLSGTTTIEGGTMVEFDSYNQYGGGNWWTDGAMINIMGTLVCNTDPYNLGVFTLDIDAAIRENSGQPGVTPYTGDATFLNLDSATVFEIHGLRFCGGAAAVTRPCETWDDFSISHCQFLYCGDAIVDRFDDYNSYNINLFNDLFAGCDDVIAVVPESSQSVVWASFVTVDAVDFFNTLYNLIPASLQYSVVRVDPGNSGDIWCDQCSVNPSGQIFATSGGNKNYLTAASLAINAGPGPAQQFGLFHFTTQADQALEGNSVVDYGYHYVALNANGTPIDTDGDGVPDYAEDANGNGIFDFGDLSNWNAVNPSPCCIGSGLLRSAHILRP